MALPLLTLALRNEVVIVRSGELRHRVTIQQKTTAQDTYGQPIETWTNVATVWASIEDLRGREFIEARQVPAAEITTRVRIRYRTGIEPTMRVIYGSRTLEITAVIDPDGRKRELELMCQEVI